MSKYLYLLIFISFGLSANALDWDSNLPDPFIQISTVSDTIPLNDRQGDFINDEQYNPFDILPSTIEQTVEYDPETNSYIIFEKIGDEYFRTPNYMTFEEYLEWSKKKEERKYFDRLAGLDSEYKSKSGKIDPMSKIDISSNLADRLFGGTDVNIEPQGNIDITLGYEYQRTDNLNLTPAQRVQSLPMFDMAIQMNVDGSIGEKLNLGFNYNTQSTFDFDRKIKLEYDTEQFSEDDIIKKIEAGNVSLPLKSSLIQGAQTLFGFKTEMQFGHLRLTGIISQQKSQNDCLDIQNGTVEEEFEIRPDEYDENRHFFISHYHRSVYEDALSNLPYINNNFRITDIQVWVSEDRPNFIQNSRMIAAVADIAEPDESLFTNRNAGSAYMVNPANVILDQNGNALPSNDANTLFDDLVVNGDDDYNEISEAATVLKTQFNMQQTRDFEVFRGRMLNASEYTFNPELGFISLNVRLQPNQVMGISYRYYYSQICTDDVGQEGGNDGTPVFKVGSPSQEFAESNVRSSINPANQDTVVEATPQTLIFTKLLKASNQRINDPTWDLMMKNVYSLRTSQLSQEDFEFDIFYENDFDDGSLTKFLPDESVDELPLLNVFNLDRLNSRNDPQPDGIFDFVPGVTIVPRTGSIIFPVLEPFGSSLSELLNDDEVAARYAYPELYDTSVVIARESLHKNKFVMKGRYKSDFSADISLGAWNIPRGSVNVRAGGNLLTEGVDYDIDYNVGRLKIINPIYLQQGVPLQVCFEDNSVFSLQQRNMMGLRADYEVSDKLNLGATYLRLFERPFTQKVNLGDDPINNRIFGLDMDYSSDAPWLTKAVDKLPFINTKQPSSVNFTAEVAAIKPGHARVINAQGESEGVVSIDDFEGAITGLPLTNAFINNQWILASTPEFLGGKDQTKFLDEAQLVDDLAYGANRALLNWYVIDNSIGVSNADDLEDSYTRLIDQRELFNREIAAGQIQNLLTFDLSFDPRSRGPYNFDTPTGYSTSAGVDVDPTTDELVLRDPESRWAGIMRYFNNNDFQAANYEFIDFWLMNPYMDRPGDPSWVHGDNEEGSIFIHLGNVSEDILHDNLQMYENSIPIDPDSQRPKEETAWGSVPLDIPINLAFDNSNREAQDLGFDGLTDNEEALKFQSWVQEFPFLPQDVLLDPANDNYVFYGDETLTSQGLSIVDRIRKFNNPQGNAPDGDQRERGNQFPDAEDMNGNKSLDQGESYYAYEIKLPNLNGEIDTSRSEFITETRVIQRDNGREEKWYRIRVPIADEQAYVAHNNIEGFRSIQFMRMVLHGFQTRKIFRMGELELVRSQWRRLPIECVSDQALGFSGFNLDQIGIQENSNKQPFGYVLPRGIQQEQVFQSVGGSILVDENAISMNFCDLPVDCQASMYKLTQIDLRLFKRLQMFVHAEDRNSQMDQKWEDGEASIFLRIGKDFQENYYEYEIPLTKSVDGVVGPLVEDSISLLPAERNSLEVWRTENKFDFDLKIFTELKKLRNRSENPLAPDSDGIVTIDQLNKDLLPEGFELPDGHSIRLKGNPSLGFVKGIEVGIRNNSENTGAKICGEVWVNELRALGLQERGGVAGLARLDVQMADFGSLSSSLNFSTVGWGSLDQKLAERQLESTVDYDIAANLELGKFFPEKWNLKIPFYGQYAKSIVNPEFDAYDLDIKVDEALELTNDPVEREDIRQRSQEVTTIKTINFINVRKEKGSGGTGNPRNILPQSGGTTAKNSKKGEVSKSSEATANAPAEQGKPKKKLGPMPWDISNFSVSYSYTERNYRDPIIQSERSQDYKLGLDYRFSVKSKFIQPFKALKAKPLRFIREFNFNLIPSSFTFSSNINRYKSVREFRLPVNPRFTFDDKRFDWQRRYSLNWELAKSLKLDFTADNLSYIDELRQIGINSNIEDREWIDERGDTVTTLVRANQNYVGDYWRDNFRDGGRNMNYRHDIGLSYNVPFKVIPILDWISAKASYRAEYSWDAGPLIVIDESLDFGEGREPGAVIANAQNRKLDLNFSFDKLYRKVKFLKKVESGRSSKSNSRTRTSRTSRSGGSAKESDDRKKQDKEPSKVLRALIRPLLALRSIKFSYKEDFRTTIPGFMRTPTLLGLGDGWSSPGWDFVTGVQPDITYQDQNNWLYTAADNGWLSRSSLVNQQVQQSRNQNYEVKINIEPFKYFKLDIDFKKSHSVNHSEEFKIKPGQTEFQQLGLIDMGSFNVTNYGLGTMFGSSTLELISQFDANKVLISRRQQALAAANGAENTPHEDNPLYIKGFGEQNADVVIPAFLATYQGKDVNTVTLDLERDIARRDFIPAPNWKLRYDGLNKLPWFKDRFQSFRINHSYRSVLQVNSFQQDVEYIRDASNRYNDVNLNASNDYYARIIYPNLTINQQFLPLIGFSMETKSKIAIDVEYAKSRNLELRLASSTLDITERSEFSLGMGFVFQNVSLFQGGSTSRRGRSARDRGSRSSRNDQKQQDGNNSNNGRGVNNTRGNELGFSLEMSIADETAYNYIFDMGEPQLSRGISTIRISPALEYDLNENVGLRLYVEYNRSNPKISDSFAITTIEGGLTVQMKLQ